MQGSQDVFVLMIAAAIVLTAALATATAIVRLADRRRARALRREFGPEYDRVVRNLRGDEERAQRELIARRRRIAKQDLRPLSDVERARFRQEWHAAQARFVDDPSDAIWTADALVQQVMLARGYPDADFEQRAKDLSVHYPAVVQHYLAAHALAQLAAEGHADTENLRQAVVHYRTMLGQLLETPDCHLMNQPKELTA